MARKRTGQRIPARLNAAYIERRGRFEIRSTFESPMKKSRTSAARLSEKIICSISYAKNFRRPQPISPTNPVPNRSSEDGSGVAAVAALNGKGPAPPTKYALSV